MQLVFATHNQHKVSEISPLLPASVKLLTLKESGITEDIPETSDTLAANAMQKAMYVYEKLKLDCFSDDTGLEIDALGGRPGVYSARYAGEGKSAAKNIEKVLLEMRDKKNRTAVFKTIIAAIIGGKPYLFEGIVKGFIAQQRTAGENGFGYDHIFIPDGHMISFAQMSLQEKNALSHRGQAVKKFTEFLNSL
jgi:XTP/dITP diphosphohydrolase